MSDYPAAPEPRQEPAPEPAKFTLLKRLTIVSLLLFVLAVAAGLLGALDADAMREQLELSGSPADETTVQLAQAVAIAITAGGAVGGLAAYVLVVKGLYKRRNWARVLGIVCAILSVAAFGFSLTASAPMLTTDALAVASFALEALALLVSLYWLFLAFSPEVGRHLRRPHTPA